MEIEIQSSLRDGSGVASSRKELCGCQAGAASGTTAPTPGRPYRAYPFFTNEAHFRITDSSHNFFPFFHRFYAPSASVVLAYPALKGRAKITPPLRAEAAGPDTELFHTSGDSRDSRPRSRGRCQAPVALRGEAAAGPENG